MLLLTHESEPVNFSYPKLRYLLHDLTFRLQTGMRGAFGKAHGTAARVKIGQILISVRSYDKFKVCVEDVESLYSFLSTFMFV